MTRRLLADPWAPGLTPGARRSRLYRWNRDLGLKPFQVYGGQDLIQQLIVHGYIGEEDARDDAIVGLAIYQAACDRFGI